jgi:tRNA nucleotidyltransferase/poly(A) polymerase
MPDYMFLLESRLSAEQRAAVMRVQELAAAIEANVYLVGGAVRDLISGMPIRDLDFVIEGNPFRIARELEKGGARVLSEEERLRHVELVFAGDVDGSIAAARDDVYHRPGTKPEIRWSTVMEDLRRRDFSLNAIAISLNPASRGLLLDPTNGLADLEKREVRALSIHSFTNQPVRLLRVLRYCARMSFKMESRTAEWFSLAIERELHEVIPAGDVGKEVRQLAREEKPAAILKSWETRSLIGAIHPQLARRHPHYDALNRLVRVRDDMVGAGYRPRLFAPATRALLGRLKPRERSAALARMDFRSAEREAILHLEAEAKKLVKILASRKTAAPRDAYNFLEKVPLDLLAFILAEFSNAKVLGKIRNFLYKWRPLRQALPLAAAELEGLGMPRGPKFDKVLEDLFQLQLLGKGRDPEDRIKRLRKLAGIKEPPKKKPKEERKKVVVKAGKPPKKKEGKGEPQPAEPEAVPAAVPGAAAGAKAKAAPASAAAEAAPAKSAKVQSVPAPEAAAAASAQSVGGAREQARKAAPAKNPRRAREGKRAPRKARGARGRKARPKSRGKARRR